MQYIISHRGNTIGPIPNRENDPEYLMEAIDQGFNVEVDVWLIDNNFWLGHDAPQYQVEASFLLNEKFWHHAKNIDAMHLLNRMRPKFLINCFYHQTDDCVLTSGGWIWTYPGKDIVDEQAIAVMPEQVPEWDISKAGGICTDFVFNY